MFSERINALFDGAVSVEAGLSALPIPGAVMPYNANPQFVKKGGAKNFTEIEPVRAFDNLWWVGTDMVGAFVIDIDPAACGGSGGYVLLDAGWGPEDCAVMVRQMKDLGLDPSKIRCILISHEHADHYGGVNYLLENVCPDARVVMSLWGWNFLQCAPTEFAYVEPRLKRLDLALTDLMKFKVGDYPFMAVMTPGHSPGCTSFIFPVLWNGEWHMAGIMGGTAVWPNFPEIRQYSASVEYFKIFSKLAGCDIGLGVHRRKFEIDAVRELKPEDPHPWYFPGELFDKAYLQSYRASVARTLASDSVQPYMMPVGPDGKARPEKADD